MFTWITWALAIACGGILLGYYRRSQRNQWLVAQMQNEIEDLRAQLHQALDWGQIQQETFFNHMLDGVLVLDAQHHVRLINRTLRHWFRIEENVHGRTLMEVLRHHEVKELVRQAVTAKNEAGIELELALPGAAPLVLQTTATVFTDTTGSTQGTIIVFHDLTRLKRLENLRQEFVANVSHELRTPLSMIKGSVETLLDGAKDDPKALGRFLEMIQRHTNRLSCLIEDLLTLSRLDSGRLPFHCEPVGMHMLLKRVMDDLGSQAAQRKTTLQNKVPTSLCVLADADRLYQVLFNLIDNAIKYGRPEGQVVTDGRIRDDNQVEISVRDDGPGIPPESLDRVFERFYRADRARSREQGGTGLGLAIVKHLIQAQQGKVWVESPPGMGATFFFTLPAHVQKTDMPVLHGKC